MPCLWQSTPEMLIPCALTVSVRINLHPPVFYLPLCDSLGVLFPAPMPLVLTPPHCSPAPCSQTATALPSGPSHLNSSLLFPHSLVLCLLQQPPGLPTILRRIFLPSGSKPPRVPACSHSTNHSGNFPECF